jgi:hypothetical protein
MPTLFQHKDAKFASNLKLKHMLILASHSPEKQFPMFSANQGYPNLRKILSKPGCLVGFYLPNMTGMPC